MDIRKYEVIIKAAECRNLTKAGEFFGYTQSGVSHMIKVVEEELGFRVLNRSRSGVSLTPEGERIIPVLREIARWNENLVQIAADINGLVCGNLRVGVFSSVAIHWLPRILRDFQADYPHISIDIIEGGSEDMRDKLSNGEIDLALMSIQPNFGFEAQVLKVDSFFAVLPHEHPLAKKAHFPLEAFNGSEFILVKRGYDDDIYKILAEYSLAPNIKFTSNNEHAVVSMIESGLGVSILPELVVRSYHENVSVLPLSPEVSRKLGICVTSFDELSPACRRFCRYVRKTVAPDGAMTED